ncbi:MAG TPA: response regulator [Anaeromyxobacteraceae bacterium]|jgi:DNA-binding response OmpR family regulator|nr:response regulator [Anaeromyxobacteraceae bacterium]
MACARVLLIETDASIRETLREILEAEGFAACPAKDYLEAQRLVDAGCAPAAVILDVGYPLAGALETMRRLRSEPWFRELPLILTTAFPVTRDEQGTAAIIEKPYDVSALLGALRLVMQPAREGLVDLGRPVGPCLPAKIATGTGPTRP